MTQLNLYIKYVILSKLVFGKTYKYAINIVCGLSTPQNSSATESDLQVMLVRNCGRGPQRFFFYTHLFTTLVNRLLCLHSLL